MGLGYNGMDFNCGGVDAGYDEMVLGFDDRDFLFNGVVLGCYDKDLGQDDKDLGYDDNDVDNDDMDPAGRQVLHRRCYIFFFPIHVFHLIFALLPVLRKWRRTSGEASLACHVVAESRGTPPLSCSAL